MRCGSPATWWCSRMWFVKTPRERPKAVNAKYELMERGGYIPTGYKFDPVVLNAKLPLEFFEARNALRIAQSEGAEQYASDSYQHAVQLMNNADEYATRQTHRQEAVDRSLPRSGADCRRCARHRSQEDGRGATGERAPGFGGCAGAIAGRKRMKPCAQKETEADNARAQAARSS